METIRFALAEANEFQPSPVEYARFRAFGMTDL